MSHACSTCGKHIWRREGQCRACWLAEHPHFERTCEVCGKPFKTLAYFVDRGQGRFCSASCRGKTRAAYLNAVRRPAESNPGWFQKGQNAGQNSPKWTAPLEFTCLHCKSKFYRKPWATKQEGRTNQFCSPKCRGQYRAEHLSGPDSPMWVGGPKTYRGRSWNEARRLVVDRQGGKCAKCGREVGPSLPVHHIRPFRDFTAPEEANAPANLVGLCQSCHLRIEYGSLSLSPHLPSPTPG
jgi:hypothetical protein